MDGQNLIVLTIYIICVSYVLYGAINSIDRSQVTIRLDQDSLNEQLEEKGLRDWVSIQVPLGKRYELEKLNELSLRIENSSPVYMIEVDWNRSSLTDFDGRSRRVIRLTPSMNINLSVPQVPTVISPTQSLKEKITAEEVLKSEAEAVLKIFAPLFELSRIRNGSAADKKRYTEFMTRNNPLSFSLSLALGVLAIGDEERRERTHIVSCDFIVQKLPWTEAIRLKPKKVLKI